MELLGTLKAKAGALIGSEIEKKVKEATGPDNWNVSNTLKNEIATATYNYGEFSQIMPIIWDRLDEEPYMWKMIFKTLILVEHLVRAGSNWALSDIKAHGRLIQRFTRFSYVDDDGRENGHGIRETATIIVKLLVNEEELKAAREKGVSVASSKCLGISSDGSRTNVGTVHGKSMYGGFSSDSYSSNSFSSHNQGNIATRSITSGSSKYAPSSTSHTRSSAGEKRSLAVKMTEKPIEEPSSKLEPISPPDDFETTHFDEFTNEDMFTQFASGNDSSSVPQEEKIDEFSGFVSGNKDEDPFSVFASTADTNAKTGSSTTSNDPFSMFASSAESPKDVQPSQSADPFSLLASTAASTGHQGMPVDPFAKTMPLYPQQQHAQVYSSDPPNPYAVPYTYINPAQQQYSTHNQAFSSPAQQPNGNFDVFSAPATSSRPSNDPFDALVTNVPTATAPSYTYSSSSAASGKKLQEKDAFADLTW